MENKIANKDDFSKKEKKFNLMLDLDEKMLEYVDEMMKDIIPEEGEMQDGKPMVFGVSMKINPDGKAEIDNFGDIKPKEGRFNTEGGKEPLIDVVTEKEEVVVTAELPGIEKKDLELKTKEGKVTLSVDSGDARFFKEVEVGSDIDEDSAKANFKNGVLEVRIKRKASGEGREIRID